MNTNLHAWLILALGVSSPSAAAIASGSSTSVATSTVEVDDDQNGGMASSFTNRHKLHLRHDNHANVETELFLRHHRELQGLICDANSDPDVVGKSCTNNKDCPVSS
jgi:hypothetical protein